MIQLILAAALPGLLIEQPPVNVEAIKTAGQVRIYAPSSRGQAWKDRGITVIDAAQLSSYEHIPAPAMKMVPSAAAATSIPFIEANGWRFHNGATKVLYAKAPAGSAALAIAEAYAYGVDAVVEPAPADIQSAARMLIMLAKAPESPAASLANIGLIKTGSKTLPEVMNLFIRRNLLFRLIDKRDPSLDLNIQIGSAEYPEADAARPYEFSIKVRNKLGDEKRLLRIYNTSVAIGRLTGDARTVRLHLLNYIANRPTRDVRVRVRGNYRSGKLIAYGTADQELLDFTSRDGAVEFTIPELNTYAIVDLIKGR